MTLPSVYPLTPQQLLLWPTKRCLACDQILPVYDYYPKDKTGRPFARCKRCTSHNAAYYDVQQDRIRLAARGLRRCPACLRLRWLGHFWTKLGRPQNVCKDCHRAWASGYVASHRAEIYAYQRAYYIAHRAAVIARQRDWERRNPDRARATRERNLAARKARNKRWREANPDTIKRLLHKRRARIKANGGDWTEFEWQRLKARCHWTCLKCGRREPDVVLSFDHIVPISMGGFNIISNAQVLCRMCNSQKRARLINYLPPSLRWRMD